MTTERLALLAIITLGLVFTAFIVAFGTAALALSPCIILPILPMGVMTYVLVQMILAPIEMEPSMPPSWIAAQLAGDPYGLDEGR